MSDWCGKRIGMIDRTIGNKGGLQTTGKAGLVVAIRLGQNHRSLHRCLRQRLPARDRLFPCLFILTRSFGIVSQ